MSLPHAEGLVRRMGMGIAFLLCFLTLSHALDKDRPMVPNGVEPVSQEMETQSRS